MNHAPGVPKTADTSDSSSITLMKVPYFVEANGHHLHTLFRSISCKTPCLDLAPINSGLAHKRFEKLRPEPI